MDLVRPDTIARSRTLKSILGGGVTGSHASNEGNTHDFDLETREVILGEHSSPSNAEESEENNDEYPHGLTLFFVVVALVLSIFLVSTISGSYASPWSTDNPQVALDMVCITVPYVHKMLRSSRRLWLPLYQE